LIESLQIMQTRNVTNLSQNWHCGKQYGNCYNEGYYFI